MATLASIETAKTIYYSFESESILTVSGSSQGQEGHNLQKWVNSIFARWQEQPARALTFAPKLWLEPDPEQAARNQGALELLRSWREKGDEQEQGETWAYLQSALNENRLSNRPLF